MHKLFLYGGTLALAYQLAGCQTNTTPAPLRLETTPALSGSTQGLASDGFFAPFYATQQESATYRLTAIRAYARADPKADSSTLQFIYQGNQLVDKKLRRAGSSMLTDLPRKLTFDANNRLIASDATATTVASQTGVNGDVRTEYTYERDALTRAVRYTRSAGGALILAVEATYTYQNGRYSTALINSYVSQGGSTTVSTVPLFTYQRAYTYAADGRSLTITDNGGTVIIDAQLDERGTVVREEQRNSISPEAYRPVFFSMGLQDVYRFLDKPKSDLFEYTYNGPGGLISEVYNRSTGITYRFLYEPK